MTLAEAISVLNMVEAYGLADDAKKMAIRSLGAWDKVRTEIETEANSIPRINELYNAEVCGLEMALEIINKHLAEVTRNESKGI